LHTLLDALPTEVRNYGLMGDNGSRDHEALQHELSIHKRLTTAIVAGDLLIALAIFDEHQTQEADLIHQYYAAQ